MTHWSIDAYVVPRATVLRQKFDRGTIPIYGGIRENCIRKKKKRNKTRSNFYKTKRCQCYDENARYKAKDAKSNIRITVRVRHSEARLKREIERDQRIAV